MTDFNKVRNLGISLHGFENVDEIYTLYYDETNNIRRLLIKSDRLNVQDPGCYVLGGVALIGEERDLNIEKLRLQLKMQKSAIELKLRHVGKGTFLDLLSSQKTSIFLTWLLSEKIWIHFQVVDVIYWSTVDIVDSILTELKRKEFLPYAPILKDDLYAILRHDIGGTVEMYNRYSYPNVGRAQRTEFLSELTTLLKNRCNLLSRDRFELLNHLLKSGIEMNALPYLENEEPRILLDRFSDFYFNKIFLFKNSVHIFDNECVVERELRKFEFEDKGWAMSNFQFVDSRDVPGVQISDVIVGLLGKFFTFINQKEIDELEEIRCSLLPRQEGALSLLRELISLSASENAAFSSRVHSLKDDCKAAFFLGL